MSPSHLPDEVVITTTLGTSHSQHNRSWSIELASAILVSAIRAPSFTALFSIIGARN
jgi:hypothetical protein